MGSRDVTVRQSEGGVAFEIDSVRSRREVAVEAVKSAGYWGGVAGISAAALTVLYAMSFLPKRTLESSWVLFADALSEVVPIFGPLAVPLVLGVFLLTFVVSASKGRELAVPYRIAYDEERLRVIERTVLGDRTQFEADAEEILAFQAAPVQKSGVESRLPIDRPYEITVTTDDDIYTFGAGLPGGVCRGLADTLERMTTNPESAARVVESVMAPESVEPAGGERGGSTAGDEGERVVFGFDEQSESSESAAESEQTEREIHEPAEASRHGSD